MSDGMWKDSTGMGPLSPSLDDLTLYYVLPGDKLLSRAES